MLEELRKLLNSVYQGNDSKVKNLFAVGFRLGLSKKDILEYVKESSPDQIKVRDYTPGVKISIQYL